MGIRELLILILGLAVVSVILRGLYVAMQARRGQIRLAIDRNIPQDVDLEELEMSELPSGGARVIQRSLASVNQQNTLQNELDLDSGGGFDESVPILLDTVEIKQTARRPDATGSRRFTSDESDYEETPVSDSMIAAAEDPWHEKVRSDSAESIFDYPDEEIPDPVDHHDAEDESDDWLADELPESEEAADTEEMELQEQNRNADYLDEFDGDDEDDRSEPGLDLEEDFEDEFGDFSLSAGERIGGASVQESGRLRKRFVSRGGQEQATRKESLFSRFGRKHQDSPEPEDAFPASEVDSESAAGYQSEDDGVGEVRSIPRQAAQAPETKRELRDEPVKKQEGGVTDFNQARETRRPAVSETSAVNASSTQAKEIEPSEVLVVNVMSREGEMFHGRALRQVLISAGLRHGEMNIFHRHRDHDGNSPIIFSVANILNPGTFDLDNMDELSTRGVSLFLAMPSATGNREAFEDMLRTAQQLRAALDGELRDDHRHLMTAQTIEHYRQRINDYELRKLKAAQARS